MSLNRPSTERTKKSPPPDKILLSLCMIVRDEEEFLPRCLSSAAPVVDEIIIVDTGSSDRTPEIASEFGAQVLKLEWPNDYSEARNHGLSKAKGEWILVLDADEELDLSTRSSIRSALTPDSKDVGFYLTFVDLQGETEETSTEQTFLILRLFRNLPTHRFKGRIHEQVQLDYDSVGVVPARIKHFGNLAPITEKRQKRRRDTEMLKDSGWGDEVHHLWIMANEDMNKKEYQAALEKYLKVYERLKDGEKTHLPNTFLQIIKCFQLLGRDKERDLWIDKGLERWPHYTDLEYLRAFSYLEAKNYRKALHSFRACIALGEPSARFPARPGCYQWDAWTGIGICFGNLREWHQAIDAFTEALKQNPRSGWAADNLTTLLLSLNHDKKSVRDRMAKLTDMSSLPIKEIFKKYLGGTPFRYFERS